MADPVIVKEWLAKAENDYQFAALIEISKAVLSRISLP
jgi:hypothetical protein